MLGEDAPLLQAPDRSHQHTSYEQYNSGSHLQTPIILNQEWQKYMKIEHLHNTYNHPITQTVHCDGMPLGAAWAYYIKVLVLASTAS